MYQVLLLVLSLAAFSQQHCRHHDHTRNRIQHRADYHARVFEDVAREVIELDRKSQQLCEAHANSATKEVFEKNRYVLKVALDGFTEEEIKVEVRHRVIYINAFKADHSKHYSEVKELPAYVNVPEARFTYEDGVLKVVFPVKNTIVNSCNPNIVDEVVNVPKYVASEQGMEVRFGQ